MLVRSQHGLLGFVEVRGFQTQRKNVNRKKKKLLKSYFVTGDTDMTTDFFIKKWLKLMSVPSFRC